MLAVEVVVATDFLVSSFFLPTRGNLSTRSASYVVLYIYLLDNQHYNGRESFKGYGYYFFQILKVLSDNKCCAGKIFGNKEMRLLMLGLDAAGKTSESMLLL